MWRIILNRSVFLVLLTSLSGVPFFSLHASPVNMHIGTTNFTRDVKSILEIRWNKLSRQGWDISCGAAALSTMLTYHNERPYSEMAITLSILKNSDPALVRARGGFSLFDLKRFVNAVGLEGLGYGDMTLDDLDTFAIPAILPVRVKGLDHFIIFRKRIGNKVFIGDPAFGNISFSADRFLKMWKSKIAFYVVTAEEKQQLAENKTIKKNSALSPQAMELAIPSPNYTSRLLKRIPIVPVTRRPAIHSP
jgi:predicted double-glycine peptidase